ncbi:MAG: ArsA family ATPase [Deltaproteobacteria bacterium]|nr:ArsA family ATPase [Deltaproteobacteria bacterium]
MLLIAGCGGVGKTTTCAALGLAAARRGKRVLCLTIDPARRLAESLGLERVRTEAQSVAPEVFAAAGLDVPGSLTVMMLDTKSTFDALVTSLAKDDDRRQRIMGNVLYKYISTKLAGTQEYMAMEKLYAVKDDPAYDLILLDTPPTSHALDFLDAPERLVDAIDSPAVRWFMDAFEQSGRFSLNLLQRTASSVLRGIGRITGGGFLEQVASFMSEINELFGGWKQRAELVSSALRGPEVGYLLVTTPDPMSLREVRFFAERLGTQGVAPSAYVVNRVHHVTPTSASEAEVTATLARHGVMLGADGPKRVLDAAKQERRLGELDRLHLIALEGGEAKAAVVEVPDFPRDIHDVGRLAWVADVLC